MNYSKELAVWKLDISPFERVLLWAARADLAVLRICAHQTRQVLVAMGLSLVFVSVVTFLASLLALIELTFPREFPLRWPLSVCIALIVAAGMLLANRTVLAFEAVGRRAGFFLNGLILAMGVGFSVAMALPLEMVMFADRIEMELGLMTDQAADPQPSDSSGREISFQSTNELDAREAERPTNSLKAKKQALKRVIGSNSSFHLILMGFMLLLELLPFLLKRDLDMSEYRCLLAARRTYNGQKELSTGVGAGTGE